MNEKQTTWKESKITLETKIGEIFGTLCTPKNFRKGTIALIIAGSGPTDRNGNNPKMKCDAYKLLAHQLADNQIATVRYDKRGIGESKEAMKNESDIRFDDYINDSIKWINMLKADKRFSKVVIIGHSEGSLIGMIAARKGADKYISIAGVGESADKTLKRQLKSLPKQEKDTAYKIIDSLVAGKTVSQVDSSLYSLFRHSVQPYMISWFKYDPTIEIKKLNIPLLILQGTNDLQVTIDDAQKLEAANPKGKLSLLENMNHVFRIVNGTERQTNFDTYNNPSLPIDKELVSDISNFVNKN